jgi:hypothetical protein
MGPKSGVRHTSTRVRHIFSGSLSEEHTLKYNADGTSIGDFNPMPTDFIDHIEIVTGSSASTRPAIVLWIYGEKVS